MGNAISMALAMWISVLFFSSWLSPSTKRKIVGMGLLADITVHFVLQTMFGGDAEGRAGLLLAGVLVNLTMHLYRRWAGWEKLTWSGWEHYSPQGKLIPRPPEPEPDEVTA